MKFCIRVSNYNNNGSNNHNNDGNYGKIIKSKLVAVYYIFTKIKVITFRPHMKLFETLKYILIIIRSKVFPPFRQMLMYTSTHIQMSSSIIKPQLLVGNHESYFMLMVMLCSYFIPKKIVIMYHHNCALSVYPRIVYR